MSDALSTPSPAALSGDTLAQLPRLMVVMGVSACGKSTVANALAQSLAASFMDADDYHSAESIKKMSRGHFMPGSLLDSQFATLERPDADELSCTINIDGTPQQIMQRINAALQAFE